MTAAQALFKLGDLKRGTKILRSGPGRRSRIPKSPTRMSTPAPVIRPTTGWARAKKLAALRPNHVESVLVVARAALRGGRIYRGAEIDRSGSPAGATGRHLPASCRYRGGRDRRTRAACANGWPVPCGAPRDPAWVADGFVFGKMGTGFPLVTGRLDGVRMALAGRKAGAHRGGRRVGPAADRGDATPAPAATGMACPAGKCASGGCQCRAAEPVSEDPRPVETPVADAGKAETPRPMTNGMEAAAAKQTAPASADGEKDEAVADEKPAPVPKSENLPRKDEPREPPVPDESRRRPRRAEGAGKEPLQAVLIAREPDILLRKCRQAPWPSVRQRPMLQSCSKKFLSFLKDLPTGGKAERESDPVDDPRVAAAALMFHVVDADGVRDTASATSCAKWSRRPIR